jgi:hypothetical protein
MKWVSHGGRIRRWALVRFCDVKDGWSKGIAVAKSMHGKTKFD